VPAGSNWQTPQDLHKRPAFAEFVKLVEMAARGVARFLQVDQYPMVITGCWGNINPPGAYHPTHHHPNNYLSGVYYVAVPAAGSRIQFQDPRPSMIMPKAAAIHAAHRQRRRRGEQGRPAADLPGLGEAHRAGQRRPERAHQHLLQLDVLELHGDDGLADVGRDGGQGEG
jgi:hypothetical protein